MTRPLSSTFVRAWKPSSDDAFRTAHDRMRVQSAQAEAFTRFEVGLREGRGLSSASLRVRSEDTFVGTATARSVDPTPWLMRHLTWNTRPAVVAGSANRTAVKSGALSRTLTWDVTADYADALAGDRSRLAFKLSSSSSTIQWLRTPTLELTIVTYALATDPTGVSPTGVVGTAKPTFTWTAPAGITKVQVQVDEAGGDFTTPVWDSTELNQSVPNVNSATGAAWAGISGTMPARVRHFTPAGGWSAWVQVSLTYSAPTNFVVSNPVATDADPTPPSVWTPSAQAVRIVSYLDGDRVHDTGIVPGPVSDYTPAVGASVAGQVLRRVHQLYDGTQRVQPAFVTRETSTTWTPTGTVAGLSTFTASQDGTTPCVASAWTRGTTPDEVGIQHDDRLAATVDGPAGSYRDWTTAPNTDVVYGGRAVVNHKHSTTMKTQPVRTRVTGVWLVDPVTERGFVLSGIDGLDIGLGGEVVVHTPIDGAVLLRRTLTLRGPEGSMLGRITDWPGRTLAQQKADAVWLRENPQKTLRLVLGDLNVPVVCSSLEPMFDKTDFRTDRDAQNVSFDFSHAGGY